MIRNPDILPAAVRASTNWLQCTQHPQHSCKAALRRARCRAMNSSGLTAACTYEICRVIWKYIWKRNCLNFPVRWKFELFICWITNLLQCLSVDKFYINQFGIYFISNMWGKCRVMQQRDDEQWAPEEDVCCGDDDEHSHTSHPLTLHPR